jgi:hypothetical protein
MGFVPLDPVNVPIGRLMAKHYPKIKALIPVHEHVHSFQANKAALTDLPTNFHIMLDAFGTQLNASATMEGIQSKWRHFFQDHWMNFCHLTILSFHHSAGDHIANTTTRHRPSSPLALCGWCPCKLPQTGESPMHPGLCLPNQCQPIPSWHIRLGQVVH